MHWGLTFITCFSMAITLLTWVSKLNYSIPFYNNFMPVTKKPCIYSEFILANIVILSSNRICSRAFLQ